MTAALEYLGVIGTWAIHRIPLISLELGVFALLVMILLKLKFLRPARIQKWFWLMVLAKPVAMLIIISPLALNLAVFQDVHALPQITLDSGLSQPSADSSGEVPLPAFQPQTTGMALPHPSFWSRLRGSLNWSHGLMMLWISGSTFLCVRAFMGFRKLSKLRQEAVPLDYSHDILTSLGSSLSMRRLPEVRVSVEVSSPLLFGLFHPVILLPSGFYERSSPEELRLMLLHELFHWKHGDIRMLLFKRMVEAFFFFHPAVWYAGRIAVRASEQICDDAVVSFTGSSASYASCLLSISENAGNQRRYALAGLAVRDSAVGQRIKRILREGFPMISRKAVLASMSVLTLVSVLGLPTFLISKSDDRVSVSSLSILGGIELVRFAGAQAPKQAQITFNSNRDGNGEIYVMDADGGNQRNLTNNPAEEYVGAWSPDGEKIAFESNRGGTCEIYVMDADGKNIRNLTNHPAEDWSSSWSLDGKKITFQSDRDGNFDIYVMDADGKNPRNLTNNPARDGEPAWSPDGKMIAFQSDRDGNTEIYVMDADGGNEQELGDGWCPSWSPDGQRIAFASKRDGDLEIYVMDAGGKNQRRLTNHPAVDAGASWSPDGQRIAFHSNRDGNNEIYVMDADGKNQRNLTNNPAVDWSPDWFDPAAIAVAPAGKLKTMWGKIKRGLFSR